MEEGWQDCAARRRMLARPRRLQCEPVTALSRADTAQQHCGGFKPPPAPQQGNDHTAHKGTRAKPATVTHCASAGRKTLGRRRPVHEVEAQSHRQHEDQRGTLRAYRRCAQHLPPPHLTEALLQAALEESC